VIIFQDGGIYHPPIRSKLLRKEKKKKKKKKKNFIDAYYVVSPHGKNEKGEQLYRFAVCGKDGVCFSLYL
jgi:hypothetical protein